MTTDETLPSDIDEIDKARLKFVLFGTMEFPRLHTGPPRAAELKARHSCSCIVFVLDGGF